MPLRLRQPGLRAQVAIMLACVALVSATLTYCFVVLAVKVALHGDVTDSVMERTLTAVTWGVGIAGACVMVAALGAATFLRGSIHRAISDMQRATVTIARGGFHHRIASTRSDELGGLAASIDAMARELHRLEAARQHLLAGVSHELRTPLTVIRGMAFTLGRHEEDLVRRERFDLIDGESERLAALIDDLLEAATLRARPVRLNVGEVSAVAMIEASAARFADQAAARGIEVRVTARGMRRALSVDRARVDQVLANLMSNAVAHAPVGSVVHLRAAGRGAHVRISVVNAGPGIPADRIDTIFEPFVQGSEPTGAVGLGLSIARELVRAHGSELHVASRAGRTRFWFDLPEVDACSAPTNPIAVRYAT